MRLRIVIRGQTFSLTAKQSDQKSKRCEIPVELTLLSAAEGQIIANTARSWIGTPYITPGITKAGADCNGTVYGIYNEAGFPIPHVSSSNYPTLSQFKPAPDNTPQVGDVGWWDGHVMIYDPNAGMTNRDGPANGWSASHPGGRPFDVAKYQWYDKHYGTKVKWLRYDKHR